MTSLMYIPLLLQIIASMVTSLMSGILCGITLFSVSISGIQVTKAYCIPITAPTNITNQVETVVVESKVSHIHTYIHNLY